MSALETINSPLAAVLPKSLKPLGNPIGALRKEAGGNAGTIIDPFGAFIESQKELRKPVQIQERKPVTSTKQPESSRSSLLLG